MRSDEIKQHLSQVLLPYWKSLRDDRFGGYYGEMDYELVLHKKADKGGILNSRILWFFANASITLADPSCLDYARHAYEFLKEAFYDQENGGIFWSVSYDRKPQDDSKHTYNQAFAIYALASYYEASGDDGALRLAYQLVDKVETVCKDVNGYLEAFDRSFCPVSNEKLSENGVMAGRTMNTLLHVLEAYSELYRVDHDKKIAGCMEWMLDLFADRVYNPKERRLEVFFDKDWNTLINLNSYGHDIEASWLIDRAVEILDKPDYTSRLTPITRELAAHIYSTALEDGSSLYNECEDGRVDTKKVWWVQAEGILGFLNGYQKDNTKREYLEAAGRIWDYIKDHVIDKREGSEWFNELYQNGTPIAGREIAGLWKCPYHNGRLCMEVLKRNIAF